MAESAFDFLIGYLQGGEAITRILTFIAEHQRNGHQPEFTALLSLHAGVELLESVDEEQGQYNQVLADLCSRKNRSHPLLEAESGDSFCNEGRRWMAAVFNVLEFGGLLKPEETGHLQNKAS